MLFGFSVLFSLFYTLYLPHFYSEDCVCWFYPRFSHSHTCSFDFVFIVLFYYKFEWFRWNVCSTMWRWDCILFLLLTRLSLFLFSTLIRLLCCRMLLFCCCFVLHCVSIHFISLGGGGEVVNQIYYAILYERTDSTRIWWQLFFFLIGALCYCVKINSRLKILNVKTITLMPIVKVHSALLH